MVGGAHPTGLGSTDQANDDHRASAEPTAFHRERAAHVQKPVPTGTKPPA
jgi:hypothetical protein